MNFQRVHRPVAVRRQGRAADERLFMGKLPLSVLDNAMYDFGIPNTRSTKMEASGNSRRNSRFRMMVVPLIMSVHAGSFLRHRLSIQARAPGG
jgi:hypothetical protein